MGARWSWLAALVILSVSWSQAIADQTVALASGTSVDVLSVGPMQSTEGWSALMMKYRTQIPLSDVAGLRRQADEIWDRFIFDVQRSGYKAAVLSANAPAGGVAVTTNDSYGFVFQRRDGSWRTLESADRVKAKLDTAFVKEFLARLDWAIEHNKMNAALLYMANGWTATESQRGSNEPPQTVDRIKFAATLHAAFSAAKNLHHQREILNIAIGDDGTTARVESREDTEMDINDEHIAGVERSTDFFELQGDMMLWTKSTSVIEKQTETRSD